MADYTQSPKKKKGIGDINQVSQAASGSAGASTGDASGTGANALKEVGRRAVAAFGVNPDIQDLPVSNILSNTAQNLREKGVVGSFTEGARRSIGELANQSTNYGKAVIQGGKNILFGTSGNNAPSEVAPSPAIAQTRLPEEPEINPQTSLASNVPSQPVSEFTNLSVAPTQYNNKSGTTVTFGDAQGGKGTISFAGTRLGGAGSNTTRPIDLEGLSQRIAYDSSPETQAKRDANVAIEDKNYADYKASLAEDAKNSQLNNVTREYLKAAYSGQSELAKRLGNLREQLAGEGLKADEIGSEAGSARITANIAARKGLGEEEYRKAQLSQSSIKDLLGTLQHGDTNQVDPSIQLSRISSIAGRPIIHDDLGAVGVDSETLQSLNDFRSKKDLQGYANTLKSLNLSPSIYNSVIASVFE